MTKTTTFEALAAHLAAWPAERRLVAVVGAPGSGKSTLAQALADHLNATTQDRAAVIPMDGFHYDDRVLGPMGLLPRKGSPDTFDVAGLDHLLGRLATNSEPHIAIPIFDRTLEAARAAALLVPQSTDILIVEGNYLLLRTPPWDKLARHFRTSVTLDVPRATLEARLRARWDGYGYDVDTITAKVEANDLPNGDTVRTQSAPADHVIHQS
ncbi:MAG: nucleoside/nucleotide kinase family protein [Pseudomonadota bacterium]